MEYVSKQSLLHEDDEQTHEAEANDEHRKGRQTVKPGRFLNGNFFNGNKLKMKITQKCFGRGCCFFSRRLSAKFAFEHRLAMKIVNNKFFQIISY